MKDFILILTITFWGTKASFLFAQTKPFNFYDTPTYSLSTLDSLENYYKQTNNYQERALIKIAQSRKKLEQNGLIIHAPTLRLLLEAKQLFELAGDSLNYQLTNVEINTNLFQENKNALIELQQAYAYFEHHNDKEWQVIVLDLLLSYHIHYQDFETALRYKNTIEKKNENRTPSILNDSLTFARIYFRFAHVYLEQYQKKSQKKQYLIQAEHYTLLSKKYIINLDESADWLRFVNDYFLGIIAEFRKDYKTALKYYHTCEPFVQYTYPHIQLYERIGGVYFHLKQYDKAQDYANKSYVLVKKLHDEQLKDVFRYGETWESLNTVEAENLLIKERELNLQNKSKQRQQLLLFLSIGVVATGAYLLQRQREKHQKNKMLLESQLLSLQRENAQKLMEVQEQERQTMARELHDSLGGMLSIAKLTAENVQVTPSPQNINGLVHLLDQTQHQLRYLLNHFHPNPNEQIQLTESLQDWIQQIQGIYSGVALIFDTSGIECGTGLVNHQLFRVVQELVYNAIKHANANRIVVELNYFEDNIILLVQDNGTGFIANQKNNGRGLNNIEARLSLLNGHIEFGTQETTGTHILIYIPLIS